MSQYIPELPILLVEDDYDLAGNIQDYLEHLGWKVDYAPNGAMALHLILSQTYSLAILDLNLPGINGLELCQRIRNNQETSNLPVFMLTAASSLEDKLSGFDHGADDYLAKPFDLKEMLARISALVRRSTNCYPVSKKTLSISDLILDTSLRTVTRASEKLKVTNMGFSILTLLLKESPSVVSKSKIEDHLWQGHPPNSDALRTHITVLRNAIDQPGWKPLLHTHRGIGYQISEQ